MICLQQEMIERMTALLPVERQQLSRNIVPRRDNFEVLYHLHFDNLCADFQVKFRCTGHDHIGKITITSSYLKKLMTSQEDIRFRFSYGFSNLFKRLFGQHRNRQQRNGYDQFNK